MWGKWESFASVSCGLCNPPVHRTWGITHSPCVGRKALGAPGRESAREELSAESCYSGAASKMQRPGRWWVRVRQRGLSYKVFSNVKERRTRRGMGRQQDSIENKEVAGLGNRNRANWGTQKRNSWTKLLQMSLYCVTLWAAIYICVVYWILANGFPSISLWCKEVTGRSIAAMWFSLEPQWVLYWGLTGPVPI